MRNFTKTIFCLICCIQCTFLYSQNKKNNPESGDSGTTAGALTATVVGKNISCNGSADGAAELTVSGGTAPYSYSWSNGASTEDLLNVAAGTYSVTVKDSKGASAKACIIILAGNSFGLRVSGNTSICVNGEGFATATPVGGTAPFKYSWSNGASTQSVDGLEEGSYTVKVTDAIGCIKADSIKIVKLSNIVLGINKHEISCYGMNDGDLTVATSGGIAPYSYQWSNGENAVNIKNLAAGNYSVTVRDAKGCTKTSSVSLTEPAGMKITHSISNQTCTGAAIDASVSGGTAPYSFFWSNGENTEDISGLSNAGYTLTVRDAKNCLATDYAEVTEANMLGLNASVTGVKCGNSTGVIDLSVTGASPFNFQWSNGATTEDISGLAEGSYGVAVTDVNGCIASKTFEVGIESSFDMQVNKSDLSCKVENGSIEVIISGEGSFTYSWSNGATGSRIENLPAGNYTVTVTDQNGCSKSSEININPYQEMAAEFLVLTDDCKGGSIDLTVNGGTQPYSYSWSHGATTEDVSGLSPGGYNVEIKDAEECTTSAYAYVEGIELSKIELSSTHPKCAGENNGTAKVVASGNAPFIYEWSHGAATDSIAGLSGGAYTVSVTDNYGCVHTGTVIIREAIPLNGGIFKTNITCEGSANGIMQAYAYGGTEPYSFKWSDESNTSIITDLVPGNYSLTISDANGCTVHAVETITEPSAVMVTAESSSSCRGGELDINVSGGMPPYSYEWSNGATTEDISGLSEGAYTVLVRDLSMCETSLTTRVHPYSLMTGNIVAAGDSVNLTVAGGAAPYTFKWSNGSTSEDQKGLSNGTYFVIITDSKACTINAEVTITNAKIELLTAKIDCCADKFICKGTDTSIPVTFTGSGPYTFTYRIGTSKMGYSNYSVITSSNPYVLVVNPSVTTTYELLSVGNECSNGTVCGKATIAVNDCSGGICSVSCFKSELVSVQEEGNCRTVKLLVTAKADCRHALSHYSVSVPCGKIQNVSNSRNFKVAVGVDPTTQISGFKIDDISNFGENKKASSMYVTYTVCQEGASCFDDFCVPLVAYKAATCVYYEKVETSVQPKHPVTIERNPEISSYPNPIESGKEFTVDISDYHEANGMLVISDGYGKQVYSKSIDNIKGNNGNLSIRINKPLQQGVYIIQIYGGSFRYSNKLIVQ